MLEDNRNIFTGDFINFSTAQRKIILEQFISWVKFITSLYTSLYKEPCL